MTTPTPIHPSLPPKPTFSEPTLEQQTNYAHVAEQPEASTSTSTSPPEIPMCAICTQQRSKYTCPGCSMRTCSAPCSASHKRKTGCTGERNKAKYIPMNEYTWGKMMDDYTFLEDMGRKVGDWGKEIVKGGYMAGMSMNDRGRGRGRGMNTRGRGRGGSTRGGPEKTKRDILRVQLQARDIEMEMLPVGMERRKINQSTWDFRNQTALLTIEFKFHRPRDPLAPSSTPPEPPFTLITHKNNLKTPLLSLIRSHIRDKTNSKKDTLHPEWVKQLVYPDPDDIESFSNPQCVMAAQLDPLTKMDSRIQAAYHSLDPTPPLEKALRLLQFVEFPTIEIWDEFTGVIVSAEGSIRQRQEESAIKRRKLNPKAGKATIAGLLGDYGSEEDEEEEAEHSGVLAALGDYAGSDDEAVDVTKDENVEMEDAILNGSDDDGGDVEVDPTVLLELLRAARGGEPLALDEQDAVDWEDEDGNELE